jgi:alkaline phosphatase D
VRYGKNLDLIITDQHSYRSADPFSDPSLEKLGGDEFRGMFPESAMQILDGGRGFNGGNAPAESPVQRRAGPNPRRSAPPQNDSRG